MPFPMKIQPLEAAALRSDMAKPAGKSRLKRLLERQFAGMLRSSSSEKLAGAAAGDVDSVCLDRMVLNFIEESNEKQSRCGRRRCNCFNGNSDDSSDDDSDAPPIVAAGDVAEILKGLVPCATVLERNLLADAARFVEAAKIGKGKEWNRVAVAEALQAIGYDAGVCRSRWEKTAAYPAGEYEYVDVVAGDGVRLLVDADFRSEFLIARSSKAYRAALQSLPVVFVGAADRLHQIVAVMSEAARQSLKKKGLHFPPWRKPEYMRSKWLAPYQRSLNPPPGEIPVPAAVETGESAGGASAAPLPVSGLNFPGDLEALIGDAEAVTADDEEISAVAAWQPPAVKPKAAGVKVVTGLASVMIEKP